MKRMSLQDVAVQLGYKSSRSAHRWLRRNGVTVFSEVGSKKKFILAVDFRLKYLAAPISHLRDLYGESQWQSAFKAHMDDDLVGLMTVIKNTQKKNTSQAIKQKTIEIKQGKNEMRFAEKLKGL